jgi:hypothetical protein
MTEKANAQVEEHVNKVLKDLVMKGNGFIGSMRATFSLFLLTSKK